MAIIETDNKEIRKELEALVSLVEKGGGSVHSNLVLSSFEGNLAITTKEPMAKGKEIIRLSRGTVLPEDQYNINVKGDEFLFDFPASSTLSNLQKDLVACMISLYNLTGKVAFQKKHSFLLSVAAYPSLMDHVVQGRKLTENIQNWRKQAEDGLSGDDLDHFIAETFLKTRHLGYQDHLRASSVSILMPVVDFLNHNWNGAGFSVGAGVRAGDLVVSSSQPFEGQNECYAFYGVMDGFDSLIRYDFIDESAPIIRSIPIELAVPEYGVIKINSVLAAQNKKKLGKKINDLVRYVPVMNIDKPAGLLRVSHILIPTEGSPNALRRMLEVLLINLIQQPMKRDFINDWVWDAERKVIEANLAYYETLSKITDDMVNQTGASLGLENMARLAAVQISKLKAYKYRS